jgi:type II secretory pathway pseudopilin PulG
MRSVPTLRLRRLDEQGFLYGMLLVAVLIMGILAGTASFLASYRSKREKETELLFRGQAYREAIRSYYLSNPPGSPRRFPGNLEDLLADPRYAGKRRHLRTLYPDPFGSEWDLVRARDGGIAGVSSRAPEAPLKKNDFSVEYAHFSQAKSYSDWLFVHNPGGTPSTFGKKDAGP